MYMHTCVDGQEASVKGVEGGRHHPPPGSDSGQAPAHLVVKVQPHPGSDAERPGGAGRSRGPGLRRGRRGGERRRKYVRLIKGLHGSMFLFLRTLPGVSRARAPCERCQRANAAMRQCKRR